MAAPKDICDSAVQWVDNPLPVQSIALWEALAVHCKSATVDFRTCSSSQRTLGF